MLPVAPVASSYTRYLHGEITSGAPPAHMDHPFKETTLRGVEVLNMISRHDVPTYPGLGWPGSGGGRPQEWRVRRR